MSEISSTTYGRLQGELSTLEAERAHLLELVSTTEGKDAADQAERTMREFDVEQLDMRIRRIVDKLDAARRPAAPGPHDGTVREGEVVVIDFGDGVGERYIVSDMAAVDENVDVVTLSSPLGRALLGATAGKDVQYRTPRGIRTVKIIGVGESADTAASA